MAWEFPNLNKNYWLNSFFLIQTQNGGLGGHNPLELGFGAQKRKVGAQVRTFVRNARGPSKKSLVVSKTPHGPPKKAPQILGFL